MDKIQVVAVVGPTASGKSKTAIEIAKAFNGEVISCDSMQVYKGMDIGTAKIMPAEMEGVVHHLLDIQDYDQPYNVQIFQERCRQAIEDIHARGKLPVLCGGTGLYLKAALYDYVFEQEEADPAYMAFLESKTTPDLYAMLAIQDPGSLEKIHANNRKRILRALMIAHTGMAKSEREQAQAHAPIYDVRYIGLDPQREGLLERMQQRIARMFDDGLVQEVQRLFSDPETWKYTSFQGIGYKEFKGWFEKEKTLDQVQEEIFIHTRQYSKRQMTWFRNQMPVVWYPAWNDPAIRSDIATWKTSRTPVNEPGC